MQETSRLASSTAEVILEKDMDVILPKDMGWMIVSNNGIMLKQKDFRVL